MANISKAERERRAAVAQEAQMADPNKDDAKDDAVEAIKFVKMKRDPEFYDEPHEAQVHPKEVTNFARGGWEIVSE